jgi:putative NADH-flavin reductase
MTLPNIRGWRSDASLRRIDASKQDVSKFSEAAAAMKVLVIGATGGTGSAFVAQALTRGHEVTAFVRAPDRLPRHERLRVVRGDPRQVEGLAAAMPGHDAVVSALGQRTKEDRAILSDAARSTLAAMNEGGVARLLVVSSALLFPKMGLLAAFLRIVLAAALDDSRAMERLVAESATDWTIARPPRLVDSAPVGRYRAEAEKLPPGARKITRSDLATFLLDELERPAHVRSIVGVVGG